MAAPAAAKLPVGGTESPADVLELLRSDVKHEASPLTRLGQVIRVIHGVVGCVELVAEPVEGPRAGWRRDQRIQPDPEAVEDGADPSDAARELSQGVGFLVDDRFELQARSPWPDIYCRSPNNTANGRGCWYEIKVTDR